jgi:predicted transcriptional regulator
MLNQQVISNLVTPLSPEQPAENALLLMEEQGLSQLPVVKDGLYHGLLNEESLYDADPGGTVADLQYEYLRYAVHADEHFFSAARLAADMRLQVVPVTALENEYVGSIVEGDLLRQLAKTTGLNEVGGLVVLEMEVTSFSVGELSKLVETNDAHITQLNTCRDEVTGNLIVTMRTNRAEISDVVATLQRYDYRVVYYAGEEHYQNELRRNYHHLMNFLEM